MPETRLVERLLATAGVTNLVGTRIRPIQLKQGEALPALTWQTIDIEPSNGSTGLGNHAMARIQVDSLATTYGGAKALAAAVRTALSGWSSSTASPNVAPVHWLGDNDLDAELEPGQDKPTHAIASDFLLQYNV